MAVLRGRSCLPLPLLFTIILLQTSVTAQQWTRSRGEDPSPYFTESGLVFRRTEDNSCKMCLWKDNCIDIEQDVCEYYSDAEQILKEDQFMQYQQSQQIQSGSQNLRPLEVEAEADSMLYSLAESVYKYHPDKNCIPFVSKYTNCNKDNICLGCTTCDCNPSGQWNCSMNQFCRPDTLTIPLDHRSLLIVLDNLKKENINRNRVKRETDIFISSEDEMTWMYNLPHDSEHKHFTKDRNSNDQIADSSDSDTREDERSESIAEKYRKIILHDPLYFVPDTNPMFDGSSNKIKRSIEFARDDALGNSVIIELDLKNKINEEKDYVKQSNKTVSIHKSYGKNISDTAQKTKGNKITVGSDESEIKFNKETFKDKSSFESSLNLTDNKNYNDTILSSNIHTNFSEVHELVITIFQKVRNEIKLLPFLQENVENQDFDDSVNEQTLDNADLQSKAINSIILNETHPNEIKSNKTKRSINIFGKKDNPITYDEDIKLNPSKFKYDLNETEEYNLNRLSKQEIFEWLNEQNLLNQKYGNKNYQPTSITNTFKLKKNDKNDLGRLRKPETIDSKRPFNQKYNTDAQTTSTVNIVNNKSNNQGIKLNRTDFEYKLNETDVNNLNLLDKQEITEWLNDQHPLNQTHLNTTQETRTLAVESTTIGSTTDYLIFLKNLDSSISNSDNTYLWRKPPLEVMSVEKYSNDYTYDDDYVLYEDETIEQKKDNITGHENDTMLTTEATTEYLTTTEAVKAAATEVYIDLLESAKNRLKMQVKNQGNSEAVDLQKRNNVMDMQEIKNTIDDESSFLSVNVMKRDLPPIDQDPNEYADLDSNLNLLVKKKHSPHLTHNMKDLIYNVLLPLNNILNDKQNELEELIKMKNSLIHYIKSSNNYDPTLPLINTSENRDRNFHSSINKSEMVPGVDLDFNKTNFSILDQYMSKLKNDIYKVIIDIDGIQRLHSDPSKVPVDIKLLINAMKQYVHRKGFHIKSRNKTNSATRRHMSDIENYVDLFNIKNKIIKIIELLDKDVFQDNVLASLSPVTEKVVKRVIKTYYTDIFAIAGIRVHDPHYNLTNDLRSIGSKWDEKSKKLISGSPTSKLYKMKSLYQIMSSDIYKMNDVLHLINFARTRRMMPVDELVGDTIMKLMNKNLEKLYPRILRISEVEGKTKELQKRPEYINTRPKEKESFLKQLKKLLINSKKDIVSLLHKKVPKSEIVKELSRIRLQTETQRRLDEYEDTMQRWQTQLNLGSLRKKRSARTDFNFKSRMKNILPKYLRGKVQGRNNKTIISRYGVRSPSKYTKVTAKKKVQTLTDPKKSNKKPSKVNKKKELSATKKIVKTASNKMKQIFSKKRGAATAKPHIKNNFKVSA